MILSLYRVASDRLRAFASDRYALTASAIETGVSVSSFASFDEGRETVAVCPPKGPPSSFMVPAASQFRLISSARSQTVSELLLRMNPSLRSVPSAWIGHLHRH